jgi:hypothetical protein
MFFDFDFMWVFNPTTDFLAGTTIQVVLSCNYYLLQNRLIVRYHNQEIYKKAFSLWTRLNLMDEATYRIRIDLFASRLRYFLTFKNQDFYDLIDCKHFDFYRSQKLKCYEM